MTADGDDGGADEGLKSIRAVWLSLPDEDPPERGLSDLMAAARVKAEEMARPSLWERIIAPLRRPPVLALASVMILVGGAVFIAQRKDTADFEVSPTGSAWPVSPKPATQNEQVALERGDPTTATPPAEAMKIDDAPADPAGTPRPAGDARPKRKTRADASAGAKHLPTTGPSLSAPPPWKQPAPPKAATTSTKPERARDSEKTRAPAMTLEDAIELPTQKPGGAVTTGDNARADADQRMLADSKSAPAPAAAPSPPPPATATQLHARARGAANRSDCEGVRSLSRQIAKLDAAYYKAKVVTDASLANCLAP